MPVIPSPHRLSSSFVVGIVFSLALLQATLAGPPARAVYIEPTLDPTDAETAWRWIGVLNAAPPCPAAANPGWSVRSLFSPAVWSASPELKRFCLYEWTASPPVVAPPIVGGFAQLYPDRMAVAPAAETLGPELWQTLETTFLDQAGAVPLPIAAGAPQVRVAVIDTSPTLATNRPETSTHGQTLQKLLRRLLCTGTACIATVVPRLALAYTAFQPGKTGVFTRNVVQGGHFGTIGELAEALGAELAAWLAMGGFKPPLVINLSVAWDPIYGGIEQNPQLMRPDVQAVYRAIEAAACRGAIIVAAAGNLGDRRDLDREPMLPAAWGARSLTPPFVCSEGGNPMLHAAGGVRADGDPLANARAHSAPLLAAPGDHATIEDPAVEGEPTPILTGSSVAAAVVSATAATVAYYRPDLGATEVMELVATSATPLDRNADFCIGGSPCPPVAYVSICEAARTARLSGQGQTPATPCAPRSLTPVQLPAPALVDFEAAQEIDVEDFLETYPTTEACQNENPLFLPGQVPIDPCPSFQRYGSAPRPWTVPQPNQDPCPNCLVIKRREQPSGGSSNPGGKRRKTATSATFLLDLDPSFEGRLSDATLTLCPQSSPIVYNLETGEDLSTLKLTGFAMDDCGEALLSFTLDGSQSLTIPVLVSD